MPKKKSSKNAKSKNNNQVQLKRPLLLKEDFQEYAKIDKNLGDRRLIVLLPNKKEMLAIIPGRFRKRCWMAVGDVILVSRREFQADKLDVIHKYNTEEIQKLVKTFEVPGFFLDGCVEAKNEDSGILIEEESEIVPRWSSKTDEKGEFDVEFI